MNTPQQPGFPQDDEFSLIQHCGPADTLDTYYNYQFIQGETLSVSATCGRNVIYRTKYAKMLNGATSGMIYLEGKAIQTFVLLIDDTLKIDKDLVESETRVVSGKILCKSGTLVLEWSEQPGNHKIVIDYEHSDF